MKQVIKTGLAVFGILYLAAGIAACAHDALQSPTAGDLAGGGGLPIEPSGRPSDTVAPCSTLNPDGLPTPTPIAGAPTPASIIEVTPLGGPSSTPAPDFACDFIEAYYTPTARLRIRNAASLGGTVIGYLNAGQRVQVCDELFIVDQAWFCLEPSAGGDCRRAVAYRLGGTEFGLFEVIRP